MEPDLSRNRIDRETQVRESFVNARLGHRPESLEAMDLTQFMHGGPGRFLACRNCGLILRDEQQKAAYETDLYDSVLMKLLYPRYLRAFEEKKDSYQPLLRPGAEVLEVGSHLGAFLEAAENWGWRPTGLDIGDSTSAFARKQGGTVKHTTLEDYSPKSRSPEAVFIWNCFEQLDDPATTLRRAWRLLDRHGIVVVRVPNVEFYLNQRREFVKKHSPRALKLLGYNNLLGFPYLHGYNVTSLDRLLRSNGFEPVVVKRASLLTPPYPGFSNQIHREWEEVRREGENASASQGPWIEIAARRGVGFRGSPGAKIPV